MDALTIKEIKDRRDRLAVAIEALVNEFQRETGCTVHGVELDTFMDEQGPVHSRIQLEIKID